MGADALAGALAGDAAARRVPGRREGGTRRAEPADRRGARGGRPARPDHRRPWAGLRQAAGAQLAALGAPGRDRRPRLPGPGGREPKVVPGSPACRRRRHATSGVRARGRDHSRQLAGDRRGRLGCPGPRCTRHPGRAQGSRGHVERSMTAANPAAEAGHGTIRLTGLRAHGHHGVYDFEREAGQEFIVDATLELDLGPAAKSDDIADTVHYGELADRLVAIITGEPVNLLETLASRLLEACLADDRVQT